MKESVEIMGFVTMGAAGLGAVVFGLIGPLSRWFDDRVLLLVFGIVPMIIGRCLMFPIGSTPHPPGTLWCSSQSVSHLIAR